MRRMSQRHRSREGCCSAILRCFLKLFNFLLSFVGVSLLLCSLYVLRDLPLSSSSPSPHLFSWELPTAWFDYFLLGLGGTISAIALIGHIAAETRNGCCLSTYAFFVVLLMVFEGAFVLNTFVNEDWEEDIPSDPTGLYQSIKEFVLKNSDLCKWAGLALVITEAVAAVLASCVRAVAPTSCCGSSYDSEDEYEDYAAYMIPRSALRQPLLKNGADPESLSMGTVDGVPYQVVPSSATTREKVLNKYKR